MFLVKHKVIILVYLIGVSISGYYAFHYNFTSVSDTLNEYTLYHNYLNHGILNTFNSFNYVYSLQTRCLISTLIPSMIYRVFPIGELLFFKTYIVLLCPLLPVMVYILSKKLTKPIYAFACSILVMAQTTYLQSPSNFRTVIAISFSVMLLYVILYVNGRKKYFITILLSILVVLSHYGAMLIIGLIFLGLFIYLIIKHNKMFKICGVSIVILLFVGLSWHPQLLNNLKMMFVSPQSIVSNYSEVVSVNDTAQIMTTGNVSQSHYDKIVQVAFGRTSFGDDSFTMNYPLFILSWLIILITMFGFIYSFFKKKIIVEYSVMGFMYGLALILLIVIPFISRIYGVERLWLQSLVILAPCFIIGYCKLIKYVKLSGYTIFLLISTYMYLNYHYGMIKSIMG